MQLEQLEQLAKELGLIIYDEELVRENDNLIYRIYLKKENAALSLKDCEEFSKMLSPLLDLDEPSKEKYFLEVSSAGLERKLSKVRHFIYSINELVKITDVNNDKYEGKLINADESQIQIEYGKEILTFKLADIKKAKTYINWK